MTNLTSVLYRHTFHRVLVIIDPARTLSRTNSDFCRQVQYRAKRGVATGGGGVLSEGPSISSSTYRHRRHRPSVLPIGRPYHQTRIRNRLLCRRRFCYRVDRCRQPHLFWYGRQENGGDEEREQGCLQSGQTITEEHENDEKGGDEPKFSAYGARLTLCVAVPSGTCCLEYHHRLPPRHPLPAIANRNQGLMAEE